MIYLEILADKALLIINFILFLYIYRDFSYKLKTLSNYKMNNHLLFNDIKRTRSYFISVILIIMMVGFGWHIYLSQERNFNISESYFRENGFNNIEALINENVPVKGDYKVIYTDLELDHKGDIINLHLNLMCNNKYNNLIYSISVGKEFMYVPGGIDSKGYSRLDTGRIFSQSIEEYKNQYIDVDVFFKNLGMFYEKTVKDVAKEKGANTYFRMSAIGYDGMDIEGVEALKSEVELYTIKDNDIVKVDYTKKIEIGINAIVKDRENDYTKVSIEGVKPSRIGEEVEDAVDQNVPEEYMNVYFDVANEGN